ncbi:MAG: Lrp/AsnC family leucine-responsive transcriptional regulator [Sphingobacteriales bacterium]
MCIFDLFNNLHMALNLDKTDFQILRILQERGRITNIQLSNEIGLSPAPTLERVKKLEKTGIIKSYHAVVDAERLGLGISTFIQITLHWNKVDAINNFIQRIEDIEEVVECYHVTGGADFLLKVQVKNIGSYERLILDRLSKIEEIGNLQTMMILSTFKLSRKVPLDYDSPTIKR